MTKRLSILQCVLIEGAFLAIAALIVFAISDYTTMTGKLADLAPYWGGIIALLTPILSMMCISKSNSRKKTILTGITTLFLSTAAAFCIMYVLPSVGFGWLDVFLLTPIFFVAGIAIVLVGSIFMTHSQSREFTSHL